MLCVGLDPEPFPYLVAYWYYTAKQGHASSDDRICQKGLRLKFRLMFSRIDPNSPELRGRQNDGVYSLTWFGSCSLAGFFRKVNLVLI